MLLINDKLQDLAELAEHAEMFVSGMIHGYGTLSVLLVYDLMLKLHLP